MKTLKKYALFLMLSFLWHSCQEPELQRPRLFKPTDLALSVSYNMIDATWGRSAGADGYKLEFSTDSLFTEVTDTVYTDKNTFSVRVKDLLENQLYYVRLCGVSSDPLLNSKWIYGSATTQAAYSIFYPVNQDSISFSSVVLTWREYVEADRIQIIDTSDDNDFDIEVTDSDAKRQRIQIEGLTAGKTYKVILFAGDTSYGYTIFTLPVIPDNMQTITEENKDNLQIILDNAVEGSTILFEGIGPFDYSDTEIIVSKSVSFIGEPGRPKPKLYVKAILIGGQTEAASASVGDVILRNIEFSGYKLNGMEEKTASEPNAALVSCYLEKTPYVEINKILLEDCIVRNYTNSFIELNDKLKVAGTKVRIGEISVNKVVVYDMGRNKTNYPSFISITNKNDKNGYCRKYSIRNSTFHDMLRGIIEARVFSTIDGYVDPDITVESCTFDRIGLKHVNEGEWWGSNTEAVKNVFDTKVSDVTANIRIQITNCIWGELFTDWLSDKFVQGMTANIVGSYMLSSTKKQISSGTTFFTTISGTGDELFPKRSEGDYTVGVSGNVALAGDPRWKKVEEENGGL